MSAFAARWAASIAQNPMKFYIKVIPVGFGITMVANYAKALLDNQHAAIKIYDHPQAFASFACIKSMWYGALWPMIPIMAFYQPRHFFVLGAGMKEMLNEIVQEEGEDEWVTLFKIEKS